jgi:hypothetical protein
MLRLSLLVDRLAVVQCDRSVAPGQPQLDAKEDERLAIVYVSQGIAIDRQRKRTTIVRVSPVEVLRVGRSTVR